MAKSFLRGNISLDILEPFKSRYFPFAAEGL
jgi:hypothetical protein